MLRTMVGAAFGVGAMVASASAGAVTLIATYSDSWYSGSWEQDSDPTPLSYGAEVTTIPIWDVTGDAVSPPYINYHPLNGVLDGGFDLFTGTQIYTGPESAPVFSVGSYTGLGLPGLSTGGVLTFTAVPEPSTWAMMLAGFVGLGVLTAATRRRRAIAA